MSIRGWTQENYEAAAKRHAKLSATLLKRYATADWGWIRNARDEVEALGRDISRWEAKARREK